MNEIIIDPFFMWAIVGLLLGGSCGYFVATKILAPMLGRFFGESLNVGLDFNFIFSGMIALGFGIFGGAIIGLIIALILAS